MFLYNLLKIFRKDFLSTILNLYHQRFSLEKVAYEKNLMITALDRLAKMTTCIVNKSQQFEKRERRMPPKKISQRNKIFIKKLTGEGFRIFY